MRAKDTERLVAQGMERYRTMVAALERSLPDCDIEQARADLRKLFGSIKIVSDAREIRFEADLRDTQMSLLKGVGAPANNVVAGAGFINFRRRRPLLRAA